MNYKAIISDFDGTLAGEDWQVSLRVQHAIRKWTGRNKHFSICTGKQYRHIVHAVDSLQLKDPQIVRGGGEIIDSKSGEVIYAAFINPSELERLVSLLDKSSIPFSAGQDNIFYTQNAIPRKEVPGVNYKKIEDIPSDKITKIVLWTDDVKEEIVDVFITDHMQGKFKSLAIAKSYSPGSKSWQITSVDGTKQTAVSRVAKMIGVTQAEIIGIGDSYNDIPLFAASGYKIAMANGAEELKRQADSIAPPYTEDGVAQVIESLLG